MAVPKQQLYVGQRGRRWGLNSTQTSRDGISGNNGLSFVAKMKKLQERKAQRKERARRRGRAMAEAMLVETAAPEQTSIKISGGHTYNNVG
jgi:hypothetical protein